MKNQTIFQVDPIALRQKLRKLGIGPGLPMSQTFAEDAVRDCLNQHATEAEVVAEDTEMVVVADVDLALLDQARDKGSVLNFRDAAEDGLHVCFDGRILVHRLPWSLCAPPLP